MTSQFQQSSFTGLWYSGFFGLQCTPIGAVIGAIGGCGYAIGILGISVWPATVAAASSATGVFFAYLSAVAIVGAGLVLGAIIGAIGLGCLGFLASCFMLSCSESNHSYR